MSLYTFIYNEHDITYSYNQDELYVNIKSLAYLIWTHNLYRQTAIRKADYRYEKGDKILICTTFDRYVYIPVSELHTYLNLLCYTRNEKAKDILYLFSINSFAKAIREDYLNVIKKNIIKIERNVKKLDEEMMTLERRHHKFYKLIN